jgi:hypothetical protein
MNQANPTLPPPTPTNDVLAFADEKGLRPYLSRILELSRQAFPQAPISVYLNERVEPPHEMDLVIQVLSKGLDHESIQKGYEFWHRQMAGLVPQHLRSFVWLDDFYLP